MNRARCDRSVTDSVLGATPRKNENPCDQGFRVVARAGFEPATSGVMSPLAPVAGLDARCHLRPLTSAFVSPAVTDVPASARVVTAPCDLSVTDPASPDPAGGRAERRRRLRVAPSAAGRDRPRPRGAARAAPGGGGVPGALRRHRPDESLVPRLAGVTSWLVDVLDADERALDL